MFAIIIRSLNALLMTAMPLALGVYLYRRFGAGWRLFGIGSVTFIASQVFHIPFNAWILVPFMERLGLDSDMPVQLVGIALFLGVSAGVFEEIARYSVYLFGLKGVSDRSWPSSLMFGAGHGGIEAIILGILVTYGFIQLLALKNANLETIVPLTQLEITQVQVDLFWSAPWYVAILGAIERAAALCFHLSATVLVLQVFRRNNRVWLFLAIGWHALVDAVAVFSLHSWGIYLTEVLILGAGFLSLAIVFALREMPTEPHEVVLPQIEESSIEIDTHEPSLDHLEESRYV